MSTMNLEMLFSPKSVAIIGASDSTSKIGGRPISYLQKFHYNGQIIPINPKYQNIGSLKCYPNLQSVPGDIEAAIVAVPSHKVLLELQNCAAKGIKAVIVFSSGFAETGTDEGKAMQTQIKQLSQKSGMRILGPNCLGIINFMEGFTGTFSTSLPRIDNFQNAKRSAFITQSGAFGIMIHALFYGEGQGFGYFVNTANEVDVQIADCISYFVEKDLVDVLAIYCEGVRDKSRFISALTKAREKRIPIVAAKVGVSELGGGAANLHTGAIAGSDEVYSAIFKQYGVVRAVDTEAVFDFVTLASIGRFPKGRRIAIITNSGGAGVFITDKCVEYGLDVPKLPVLIRAELDKILPSFGSSMNPVDCTGQLINEPELLERALSLLAEAENIDGIIVFIGLMDGYEDTFIATLQKVLQKTDKYLALSWMAPPAEAVEKARKVGIPTLTDPARMVRTIQMLVEYNESIESTTEALKSNSHRNNGKIVNIRDRIEAYRKSGRYILSEYESKAILKDYGIPVPISGLATGVDEAVKIAEEIGYPIVMKIESPDILHKTDAKCVKIGIKDSSEFSKSFSGILENAFSYKPDANVLGVNIQEQVSDSVEIIVGIKQDPVFGPCIMLGMGGIMVELIKDVSLRVLPITHADVKKMISELKTSKLLYGYRGKPAADIDALVDVIMRFGEMALDFEDLVSEMEINPLFVTQHGVMAGDAIISLKE